MDSIRKRMSVKTAGTELRDDPQERVFTRARMLDAALVFLAAFAIAAASAQPFAGSWNDGSRLAAVESLADRHTLAIDYSIFVDPSLVAPGAPPPYPANDALLMTRGTQDRLRIRGRFYSDKPPVAAILMAGLYRAIQRTSGLEARSRADEFCYLMTLGSSGIGYAAAVAGLYVLAHRLLRHRIRALGLAASLGLSTTALTYSRHANSHILLLGVSVLLFLVLQRLYDFPAGEAATWRLVRLGTLAGLAYTLDLAVGPALVVCVLSLIFFRGRNAPSDTWRRAGIFLAAGAPWVAAHHAINFAVGGTFRPANAVAQYFAWPGSSVTSGNLTGRWNHASAGAAVLYSLDLLFGRKGFLWHNLPLLLAVAGGGTLLWRKGRALRERPEILFAVAWSLSSWLIYSAASNNHAGVCASIRWFVPLLAAAYYVLAILLRERPELWTDFLVLSAWGFPIAGLMWWKGPWMPRMVPGLWLFVGGTLASWAAVLYRRRNPSSGLPGNS